MLVCVLVCWCVCGWWGGGGLTCCLQSTCLPRPVLAGVFLMGHQIRRAVVLDPATRLPRLEDRDEPLDCWRAAAEAAGLCVRVLSSGATCSAVDSDPMLLLAAGWSQQAVDALPVT